MYKITVPTIVTNGHFNKEKTLQELKRCKADRIALSIDRKLDYSFSSPEDLELLKELIEYYRQNGVETLVWLGETLGHDRGMLPAGANDKYEHLHYTPGKGPTKAFCPLDEKFQEDFCEWIKSIALCGADIILLDDDYSLRGACCCENHMREIKEVLGEEITDEEFFQKAFIGGQNRYRDAWMKVQGESMVQFSKKLREALDTVNPNVRMGVCAVPWIYDLDGCTITEIANALAGNTRPFVRLFGAPYHSYGTSAVSLAETIESERCQINWLLDQDMEILSEGDTFPRPRFTTPASYLECYDMAIRADGNFDGILKYMLDYVSDADYETGYIDFMVKNEGLYPQIEKLFADKKAVGVRPYVALHTFRDSLRAVDSAPLNRLNELYPPIPVKFAVKNSLPTTYDNDGVNILFDENARQVPLEDLKNGNIIDFPAAEILMARGIDVGIRSYQDAPSPSSRSFVDLPSEYFIEEQQYIRLSGPGRVPEMVLDDKAKVLTKYIAGGSERDCIFEYENADGLRFLVLPFSARRASRGGAGFLEGYARRRLLMRSISWLSRKQMEVSVSGNYPLLYNMIKKNETSIAVGLWNLFPDKIDDLVVDIHVPFKEVQFVNCSGHVEGNKAVIDNVLYPYEFAGVEVVL